MGWRVGQSLCRLQLNRAERCMLWHECSYYPSSSYGLTFVINYQSRTTHGSHHVTCSITSLTRQLYGLHDQFCYASLKLIGPIWIGLHNDPPCHFARNTFLSSAVSFYAILSRGYFVGYDKIRPPTRPHHKQASIWYFYTRHSLTVSNQFYCGWPILLILLLELTT